MHGKKRAEYKARLKDAKTAAAMEAKAEQWHALRKELEHRRCLHDQRKDMDTTLALLEKALLVNPDPLNLWNHRREVLLLLENDCSNTPNQTDVGSGESRSNGESSMMLEKERNLTQAALQRNPKAYGPWLHRKWIMQHFRPSSSILQQELGLTAQFLSLDERNFHCWNYRRFVVACLAGSWNGEWNVDTTLMGPQVLPMNKDTVTTDHDLSPDKSTVIIPRSLLQAEFDFTTSKIKDNFSNFSAFHYRSQLLEYVTESDTEDARQQMLQQEFQLLEDAICTEPDDQTAWWYHAILLDRLEARGDVGKMTTMLEAQADLFRELLDDSPGKWVALGLFRVLQLLDKQGGSTEASSNEQTSLLQRLMEMDGDRSRRYHELLKQHQQVLVSSVGGENSVI
jgi:geranylgeranyl transferase type-2 subunit alpha